MSPAQPDCTARPITCTPREAYFSCSLLKPGTSPIHGAHHVAQKSSTTILSFSSSDRTFPPSSAGSENRGSTSAAARSEPREKMRMSAITANCLIIPVPEHIAWSRVQGQVLFDLTLVLAQKTYDLKRGERNKRCQMHLE